MSEVQQVMAAYEKACDAYEKQVQTLRDERDRLREALEFYADPGTYHACSFIFDPPTGGFDDDFDEGHDGYDRPMPGKCARAALTPAGGG